MPLTHLVSLASYCLLVGGSGLLTAGSGLRRLRLSHRPVPSHVTQHVLCMWACLPSSFCLSKLPLFSCWTSLSLRGQESLFEWQSVLPHQWHDLSFRVEERWGGRDGQASSAQSMWGGGRGVVGTPSVPAAWMALSPDHKAQSSRLQLFHLWRGSIMPTF